MESSEGDRRQPIPVPRDLLVLTVRALRLGADAVLDRDWECYAPSELLEAKRYAAVTFTTVAERLEQLLEG